MTKSTAPAGDTSGEARGLGDLSDSEVGLPEYVVRSMRKSEERRRHRMKPRSPEAEDWTYLPDPSRDALAEVYEYIGALHDRDMHRRQGTPMPVGLEESRDSPAPLHLCRAAVNHAISDYQELPPSPQRLVEASHSGLSEDPAEVAASTAVELWDLADRLLAESNPAWAAVAAFEAGVAVMRFQIEAYLRGAAHVGSALRPRRKPENTSSIFKRAERLEIGRRLEEHILEFMKGPDKLTRNDAYGRAYRKMDEALRVAHDLRDPYGKVNLRRCLDAWCKESGRPKPGVAGR